MWCINNGWFCIQYINKMVIEKMVIAEQRFELLALFRHWVSISSLLQRSKNSRKNKSKAQQKKTGAKYAREVYIWIGLREITMIIDPWRPVQCLSTLRMHIFLILNWKSSIDHFMRWCIVFIQKENQRHYIISSSSGPSSISFVFFLHL